MFIKTRALRPISCHGQGQVEPRLCPLAGLRATSGGLSSAAGPRGPGQARGGPAPAWRAPMDPALVRQRGGPHNAARRIGSLPTRRVGSHLRPASAASQTRCETGATMTTPTDGEWMSADEALQFLQQPAAAARAICTRAHAGMIWTRARRYVSYGKSEDDVDVPREFWWAKGGEALRADWPTGDFEVTAGGLGIGQLQAFGVEFRRSDIERMKPASAANPTVPPSPSQRHVGRTVFIGHGGHSSEWLKLERFLSKRLHLSPVEFNSTSAAGVATTDRLMEMLGRADFAFLILTGEDDQATGEVHPRLNVVHEAGLFQGKLGFKKAIILLEEECEKFSNVHGLNDIRFPKGKIEAAFEQLRGVLEREKLI
jgi:predicted nucleotide-binding protein